MVGRTRSIRGWGRTEFSQEAFDAMKGAMERSEMEGHTYGLLLCKCFGKITSSGEVVLGAYGELPREKLLATTCPRGCEPIGYFIARPSARPGEIPYPYSYPYPPHPHPISSDIWMGVQALLPIVCAGTDRKIVCYKIPEKIIEYRRKEKEYGEESERVLKELIREGYSPDEAMKHPKYDTLVGEMFRYTRLYWGPTNDFAGAVERQDRLALRRYGKYGEPFLEVVW